MSDKMEKKPPMSKEAKETLEKIEKIEPPHYKIHVCPPHYHDYMGCKACMTTVNIYNANHPPPPPHEHNTTKCVSCFQTFLNGEKSPNAMKIKWQDREVLVFKPMPTYHIHMTWLILCIVSAALGFYFGYPNWFTR